MLEMLGAGPTPSRDRHEAIRYAAVEVATDSAWMVHDLIVGSGPPRPPADDVNARELAALAARSWALNCRKDPDFERMLPYLVGVAEAVNPRLHPDIAAQVWRLVAESPCAKALSEPQRRWLELFEAVARRDVARMASRGIAILESTRGQTTLATDYAFFATVTALACQGESARARDLINATRGNWVRDKAHEPEMRFLVAMTGPSGAARAGACRAGGHS
jgi:hypothetical protein